MIAAVWAAVLALGGEPTGVGAAGSGFRGSDAGNVEPGKLEPGKLESGAARIGGAPGVYLLYCGGCHGINGHSSDAAVPSLRGQVDAFLCLPEGREYIVRLPNVAFAPLDDARLAGLMNFVVGLGQTREGKGDAPYTAAEVGALRRKPLLGQPIAGYRRELVTRLIESCGAPRSLLSYGGGAHEAPRAGARAGAN